MTSHDILLLNIDWIISAHKELPSSVNDSLKALREVIHLHTPIMSSTSENLYCEGCWQGMEEGYADYPCKTIQYIQRELEINSGSHQ